MTGAPNPEPKRRRLVLASAASLATSVVPGCARAPALATANGGPFAYPFTDYWTRDAIDARARRMRLYGTKQALDEDVAAAEVVIAAAPHDAPLSVMRYFASLTAVGSTGEKFNSRWKEYENPVIVWFFHATGTTPDGDCTSWCAAFLSWTLERCGIASEHSASSQAYASYGAEANPPAPGDIVVFQNVGDPTHGHVALYLGETADMVRIIGGNQGDAGPIPSCPKDYPISSIGEDSRPKQGSHQVVRAIRHYELGAGGDAESTRGSRTGRTSPRRGGRARYFTPSPMRLPTSV
jgi:uncharacterized protein (TIGR02594 family)